MTIPFLNRLRRSQRGGYQSPGQTPSQVVHPSSAPGHIPENVNRTDPEAGGLYQDYLAKVAAGATHLPDWISRRNPFPMGSAEMRAQFPPGPAGDYEYKQHLAMIQNLNLAQQRIDKTSMAQSQQLGEWNNYESAARANIGYELQGQARNDMAGLNTRGFGGLVGSKYGTSGGVTGAGRLPEVASMAQYHRANKMVEFNAEMAKARGDVFRWGGEQQRENLSDINIEYPDMGQYVELMRAQGGGQAFGAGQQMG